MKTLKKIKLTQLSKAEMDEREMNSLKGGGCDTCSCAGGDCTCDYDAIGWDPWDLSGPGNLNSTYALSYYPDTNSTGVHNYYSNAGGATYCSY